MARVNRDAIERRGNVLRAFLGDASIEERHCSSAPSRAVHFVRRPVLNPECSRHRPFARASHLQMRAVPGRIRLFLCFYLDQSPER
jgi:hypothetical protein